MPQDDQTDSNQKKVSNEKKNVIDTGLKRILIGGGILLVVLIVFTFAQRAGRIPFFTASLLNLLILVVIVVQTYIYQRQWEVMERQSNETEKALRIGTRAYVGIHSVELDLKAKRLFIKLENIGKVPAERITIRLNLAVAVFDTVADDDGKVRQFAQEERTYDYRQASLYPGSLTAVIRVALDMYFSDEELELVTEERASLSFFLDARYWDGFTADQRSAVALAYWGENQWSLQPWRDD